MKFANPIVDEGHCPAREKLCGNASLESRMDVAVTLWVLQRSPKGSQAILQRERAPHLHSPGSDAGGGLIHVVIRSHYNQRRTRA